MDIRQGHGRDEIMKRRVDQFDLSTRVLNCLHRQKVSTIGELMALRSADVLRWPNAGRKTLAELRILLGSFGLKFLDDARPLHIAQVPLTSIVQRPSVLEDELFLLVREASTDRNANVVIKLWGWSGGEPRTLDSVGQEFSLTRERVRQIQKLVLGRLQKLRRNAPLLTAAIDALRMLAPEGAAALGAKLREMGVSRSDFSPDSLQVAAEHLRVEWPFEFVNIGEKRVLSIAGEGQKYREAIALLRRKTSERGCVNVLSLTSELKLDASMLSGLMRVLNVASEVEWLDDSHQWLYSSQSARNRLFNICSKVLGVTSRVHLSELRRAVSRSRRMAMCPPQHVLGAFIERNGLGSVDNSVVLAKPGSEAAPPADSAEAVMLRVLDEYGPVMDSDEFAERCIEAGVNATTFFIYRGGSPVIGPLGKYVYCKVGTIVPPGTVEEIVARRRVAKRVSDYGWTRAGRLWCGRGLSRMVITFGSIGLPTFVTDFVQGEWNVVLPDGSEFGKVTCRDTFIWSFSKALDVLGAEPTDLAVLQFDLKSRQVMVTVGGPDLFEAIQDPDSEILDEGPEEV